MAGATVEPHCYSDNIQHISIRTNLMHYVNLLESMVEKNFQPDHFVSKEFIQLKNHLVKMIEFYDNNFCDLFDNEFNIESLEKRHEFRMNILASLNRWNTFIVKKSFWSIRIPQFMLNLDCQCHVYILPTTSLRSDPTFMQICAMLSTITEKEAQQRAIAKFNSGTDIFTDTEQGFFLEHLHMIMKRLTNKKYMHKLSMMWVHPDKRWLFIRQFHYYLRMVKS